ncbi:MAG: Gfo/Idh/MocA family oxidoreductase [Oscillospiraceae bacterium]|nr:Gfo/Idh/MocA family oxidoreductase [Oscillospiraceae bacterium]
MKRIAILGCENSHADAFLTFIKGKEEFRDVEVVGVYSDEPEAAEKLHDRFAVPVMKHYTDAVGRIDGLIVTARHGDSHYTFARPYISSGIPMFIDKPITIREEQAITFMKELWEHGVRISGGSSLKQDEYVRRLKSEAVHEVGGKTLGGYVRAPYQRENSYGGFYFYAQHLVEMVCEIFGRFPRSVTARSNNSQIHVLFHYESYDCVGLFCNNSYHYYAARMAETTSKGFEIPSTNDWFYREFSEFYGILSGEVQAIGYDEFISPVMILNAIVHSLESGKEEPIRVFRL